MKGQHIVLIPFKFDEILTQESDYKALCDKNYFLDRVLIDDTKHSLIKQLNGGSWEQEFFDKDSHPNDYNTYAAFNERIRSILFESEGAFDIASRFRHSLLREHTNLILEMVDKENTYRLDVENIQLQVYETGVGFLKLSLSNQHVQGDDFDRLIALLSATFVRSLKRGSDGKLFDTHLPQKITLSANDQILYSFKNTFDAIPTQLKFIDFFIDILDHTIFTSKLDEVGKYLLTPLVEKEAFVLSLYQSKRFFDGIQNESKKLKDNHYKSWTNKDSLFFLNHTSLLMITPDESEENLFHFSAIYYHIISLALVLDVSLSRINDEMIILSSGYTSHHRGEDSVKVLMNIEEIYHFSVNFFGRFHFKEITPIISGLELYRRLYKNYSITSKIFFLNQEMKDLYSLYNYSDIIDQKEQQNFNDKLTVLGGLFVPIGAIGGVFGMNIPYIADTTWKSVALITLLTYGLMYFFISKSVHRLFKRFRNEKHKI